MTPSTRFSSPHRKIEPFCCHLSAVKFAQYPFPECADFWRGAAGFGIDQPIGAAIVAKNVERLDKLAGGDFHLVESGRQDADALPCGSRTPFNMLRSKPVLRIAR